MTSAKDCAELGSGTLTAEKKGGPDELKNETVYSTADKKAIIKALEAVASALSFCDADMELAMVSKLNDLHDAILELKGNDQTLA